MKYQKILGLVATAGLLLAGCATDSDNNNTWLSDSNAVHVSASVGSIFTRSNPTDETKQTSFNNGDVMGVSNNGKSLNYTFNGTDWQPGNASDYLVWDASNLNFQCWYPADGKNSFSKGYIQEDQSNATEIAKSDYMTAAVTDLTEIPGDRQLKVAMERKTARLIFNIESFKDQFTADTKVNHVRIVGKECTDASEASTINIKPLQNGEGGKGTTYTALVAPGTTEGHLYFSAEGTTETPLVVKTAALEAGKSYTYNLTVGKNTITVNDVTVADWKTGNTLNGTTDVKDKTPYVTFSAPAEQTFKMVCYGGYEISNLQYSVNFGEWKEVKADEGVTFGGQNGGLRLRGKNIKGTADPNDTRIYSTITFAYDTEKEDNPNNVKVACTGDIRTLLDYSNYTNVNTSQACFANLFNHCVVLTSAPDLPATELAFSCYANMFYRCPYLIYAPELPATELAAQCYQNMFYGCTRLTKAPKLPATKLAFNCYASMFKYCYSLQEAPELPATTLAGQCYQDMFAYCYFTKAPKLPAKIMKSRCYNGMFSYCINLTEAPELPAEQLDEYCYATMFEGCTSLTKTPKQLPAETLAQYCYLQMFNGCTVLTDAPELMATELAVNGYRYMFNNCKKLASVTMRASSTAITSMNDCFMGWLRNAGTSATSLTLKLQDKNAYDALKATSYLPTEWQIDNCTVLDNAGNAITE